MKPNPAPRRLPLLTALFAMRRPEAREPRLQPPRQPEPAAAPPRPGRPRLDRIAIERALDAGGQRQYAPRRESELLELRARL